MPSSDDSDDEMDPKAYQAALLDEQACLLFQETKYNKFVKKHDQSLWNPHADPCPTVNEKGPTPRPPWALGTRADRYRYMWDKMTPDEKAPC